MSAAFLAVSFVAAAWALYLLFFTVPPVARRKPSARTRAGVRLAP